LTKAARLRFLTHSHTRTRTQIQTRRLQFNKFAKAATRLWNT